MSLQPVVEAVRSRNRVTAARDHRALAVQLLREQVTQSFERWKMISGDHERRDFSLSYRPQIGARLAGPPAATGEPDLGFDVGWQRSRRRPRKRCCPQKLVEDLASRVEAIGEELVRQLLEALDPIVSACDRIERRL